MKTIELQSASCESKLSCQTPSVRVRVRVREYVCSRVYMLVPMCLCAIFVKCTTQII